MLFRRFVAHRDVIELAKIREECRERFLRRLSLWDAPHPQRTPLVRCGVLLVILSHTGRFCSCVCRGLIDEDCWEETNDVGIALDVPTEPLAVDPLENYDDVAL